jgi:hypothetical protein
MVAGVPRIALLGSLSTDKPLQKDADVLVTIDAAMDLSSLARFDRRLKDGADDQSWRRHLSCRWIGPLPWAHLPLQRVLCTRSLPRTPLRPTATSERRSPDRYVEPRTYQRSTHRSVAAHRQALCVPPDTQSVLAELENDETLRERNQAAAHDAN